METLITSIVAPIIVGIVLALFDHWLDHRDNDQH
ncbi:MAG: type I toxin-antitoxin system Fst family toxin [Lactobacillus crispatus]|nr:type I toxin-antitoxin system Fst family toxin [Enterococcus columbae]